MKLSKLLFVLFVLGVVIGGATVFAGGKAEAPAPAAKDVLSMPWNDLVEAAKKEGKVVLYVWYKENYFADVVKAFKAQYGIDVQVVVGDMTANFNKAIAEKDAATGTIDLMVVGGEWVKPVLDLGMMMGPMKARIPDADKLDAGLWQRQEGTDTHGYLIPFMRNQTGLLYDPSRVPNPPQTWEEFTAWVDANPKQFGFCDPTKGGSGQSFVLTLLKYTAGGLDRYYGDTEVVPDKVANWKQAWDWVNQRKDKITITASNTDSAQRVNDGELSMVVEWDDVAVALMSNGQLSKDFKLYIPKLGFTGGGDTLGVLKNGQHKAAAILLASFITSAPEQIAVNAPAVGLYPARTDVNVTGTLINSAERSYNVPEIPAQYKALYIQEFVKNCLMQ
jgi:putative spermidine/putrescine transport system substrate-binding protein